MGWENYEARLAKDSEQMRAIVEAAAKPFGAEVVDELDCDDKGFSFSVERSDGQVLRIKLGINDSGDADDGVYDVHGSYIVDHDNPEQASSWGPDNYTAKCWADYGDDDAWSEKLDAVRRHFAMIPGYVEEWQAKASPAPGA